VAIIGAGFSGLGAAIRLRKAGIHDFVVLERAGDIGGTWRDNDYPGCCCDIPSHVYSYSFELNPAWTRGFATQAEILAYLHRTAAKYRVMSHVRLDTEVQDAAWDERDERWLVTTNRGRYSAQILVQASGPLSDPSIPDLHGLADFRGTVFHSARWRHDHDLRDERVAVIGTGASAIQFVPKIQPTVGRLHVFQRTAPWVLPRLDHRITAAEHWLLRWIPFAPTVVRSLLYWALELRVVGFRRPRLMDGAMRLARWHLRRQVPDRTLRAALTPDYTLGCKRILVSDDYYPALTKPNVEVITDGVREVREHAVVTAGGREIEVDTIILGTGFHVTDSPIARCIRGRGGRTLAEAWTPSMRAYLGMSVPGFPNLFIMTGPNTGLGHNSMVFMIESQLNYLIGCLETMQARGARTAEVHAEACDAFNREVDESMRGTVWTAGHCQSWYLDSSGRNSTLWPDWSFRFRQRTRHFEPEKYQLTTAPIATPERQEVPAG
jgi:cation diffusion facilitator CzcD-associated flavoprotein CzcO